MKGKKNVYNCPGGHHFVTIDRDEGTTPFMTGCVRPGCDQTATSSFYQVPQHLKATHEWFAPTEDELTEFCRNAVERLRAKFGSAAEGVDINVREHVRRGGLLLRKIGDQKPVDEGY